MPTISALRISNFQRLTDVAIEPGDRQIVILGGDNAQGKTSVLDGIMAALAGKSAMAREPIHRGEDRGLVEVTLDDGITIRRTMTRKPGGGIGGTLKVTTADGMSPSGGAQKWLNQRVGAMTVDPLAFVGMDAKKQAETLRRVASIDTAEADARLEELRAERLLKGREAKRAEGAAASAPRHPDAPDVAPVAQEVSSAEVLAEIEAAEATQKAVEAARRRWLDAASNEARAEQVADDAEADLKRIDAEIERLKAEREAAYGKLKQAEEVVVRLGEHKTEAATAGEEAKARAIDPAPARQRLADLEATNRAERERVAAIAAKVKANQAADELQATAARLRAEYDGLSDDIAETTKARAAIIASADLPVPGLGLTEDGTVTFDGIPFAQASRAQQMRVSLGVALSGTDADGIRIALVRDASLLDANSMQLVADLAAEMGAQLWLERVGDADDGAVIIRDGSVAAPLAAAAK